jgi:hypothetical protein
MTIQDLVNALTGNQYGEEVSKEISKQAEDAGLVIVYGASDDLMEFRGAIGEELGAWEGTTAYINNDGLVLNECSDERCPYARKAAAQAKSIKAVWHDNGEYAWTFETSIPHETFDIFEDGEKFCRGIVFLLDDLGD